jgi:hypothetical protein
MGVVPGGGAHRASSSPEEDTMELWPGCYDPGAHRATSSPEEDAMETLRTSSGRRVCPSLWKRLCELRKKRDKCPEPQFT